MSAESLMDHLIAFLASPQARKLCRSYAADPTEALGELFIRLAHRIQHRVRTPEIWVRVNASGLLRNYLRREHKALRQNTEEYP
jgi:protein involved in ribonucleotide reduction